LRTQPARQPPPAAVAGVKGLAMRAVTLAILFAIFFSAEAENSSKYSYSPEMAFEEMANLYYQQVKRLKGQRWEEKAVKVHNKYWPTIFSMCSPAATGAGISHFYLMAVISSNGVVVETRSIPDVAELECFREQVSKIVYPEPPYENFFELMDVKNRP
jgi:hypothetical protein